MFQLQGAIIRPLYKKRSLSGFWCTIGIPNYLHYWGTVVYSVPVWLKIRLKWKAEFSKWSIVLKYAIKFGLTVNP